MRMWTIAAVLLSGAGVAQAAPMTLTYDFTGNGGQAGSYSFSPNESTGTFAAPQITATGNAQDVGAGFFTPGIDVQNSFVFQSGDGLGVDYDGVTTDNFFGFGGGNPISDTNPSQLDRIGPTESLTLSLSDDGDFKDIGITSITLNNFENALFDLDVLGDDDAQITLPDGTVLNIESVGGGGATQTVNFVTPVSLELLQTILFETFNGSDDYSVAGITLQATPIPEPTSLALWGIAAMGGVFYRRRRSAAASREQVA